MSGSQFILIKNFTISSEFSMEFWTIPRSNTMVANETSRQMTISDAKNEVANKTRNRPEKKKGRRFGVSRSGSRSRR